MAKIIVVVKKFSYPPCHHRKYMYFLISAINHCKVYSCIRSLLKPYCGALNHLGQYFYCEGISRGFFAICSLQQQKISLEKLSIHKNVHFHSFLTDDKPIFLFSNLKIKKNSTLVHLMKVVWRINNTMFNNSLYFFCAMSFCCRIGKAAK